MTDMGWLDRLWSLRFMAHGYCYLWRPEILWPHVISDALIAASYYSIPLILLFFVRKRRDIPFNRLMIVFAIFILACGTTHLIEIFSVWEPMYRLQAVVKMITAAVSVTAVAMLIPAIPQVLTFPSLAGSNRRLARIANELRRSNHDLAQFAYVASHDLQEPLRMVALNLDLLERRHGVELDEAAIKSLAFAREGADRMRDLLDGLLSYGTIDEVPVPAPAGDLDAALTQVLDDLHSEIVATQAEIIRSPLPRLPIPAIHARILFRHLLTNALRFRDPARHPQITITPFDEDGRIGLVVGDNGIGIPPQHRERVFRMFQRLHERGRYPGIGVGLATVKKIAERNGGRVDLMDGASNGIWVAVTFPLSAIP